QSSKRTPTCRICAQQPILRRYPTNTASSIFGGGLPVDRYPPPPQHFPGLPWALCIGFSGDGPSQTVLLRSRSPELAHSDVLRQRSNSGAFGAKRTFTDLRLPPPALCLPASAPHPP